MFSILSFILGSLLTFCLTPYYWFWLGFVSLSGLLLIIHKAKSAKKALLYGFLFGFGHHTTGLYWISNSLLVDPDKFAWLIPFAVSIIPAYLSIYIAVVCWLTKKLSYQGVSKVMFFAGSWTLAEILRGHLFTGFPWNLTGYVFFERIELAQLGSVIGFYGMSLLAILIYSAPYSFVKNYIKDGNGNIEKRVGKSAISLFFISALLMAMLTINYWGEQRLSKYKGTEEDVDIRVVQPNISQREKFDRLRAGEHLYNYYSLTLAESEIDGFIPDIIIWPEAATPYNLRKSPQMLGELKDIIPFSSYLILGTVRFEDSEDQEKYNFYNSIEIINSKGELEDQLYDKHHLVPFGEYVPLKKYLPFISKIHGSEDFGVGNGPQTLKLDNAPAFSPLICYEVIFPSEVVNKESKVKPKWILNVTNDGWFGISKGPYQHLDISRARAIEEGIPVIRAANTGISAVIDSLGQVRKQKNLNERGIIDSKLPSSLHFETFFAKSGNIISILLAGLFVTSAGCLRSFYRPFQ